MAIQVWNPWRALAEMERQMDETMRNPLMRWERPLFWWRAGNGGAAFLPPVEVIDKKDKVVIRAEVPGMKLEDFDICVEGDVLTIKGERKAETEVKDEDYYSCEISYGKFSRSLTLPTRVQADKVEANYDNGILEIALPKSSEVKPKQITVKAKGTKGK